ncbi:MAG: NAD(P)/FAD-dependent oxidoreductase [Euryarchaeota archaeon]|jgi:thioredoxin reductase|nr:NAD(P)/FAD-dependent oxidoreductase [Euryarchaeota archaeon]
MLYDLIIIGAGPAGLTAAIYARTRKLKTLVVDATEAGGQLASLYPEKGIDNYPGYVMTDAGQLATHLINHAQSMGCEIHERERALAVEDKSGHLLLRTDRDSYETKAVIIATGMGLFKPKRLGVPGEDRLEGKGVYYKLPERDALAGKKVMFVGGGNSALEMALLVCDRSDTCLVHRRDKFRADEAIVEKVQMSSIERIMSSQVVEIKGDDHVTSVVVKKGDELEERPIDAVIINIGTSSEAQDMEGWGVELEGGLIKVDTDMCTSRRGVFACGDVVAYKGKYKQIVVGCGEAAIASNSAYKYIKEPYWAK